MERRGAKIIEADEVGHRLLENNREVKERIIYSFSSYNIVDYNGNISREELGRVVFSNKEELKLLNSIIHPVLVPIFQQEIYDALRFFQIVVAETALLFDWGFEKNTNAIVSVSATKEIRRKRMVENRKISIGDADKRMNSQGSQSLKDAAADHVIVNNSTLAELEEKTDIVWNKILN